MSTDTVGTAHVRIPGWPECTWPLGCRTSVREAGRLCSPHRAVVLALGHEYEPDATQTGDVPGWRPCRRCDQRLAYHRVDDTRTAAARAWLGAEVAKTAATVPVAAATGTVLERAQEHYGDRMTPRLEAAARALDEPHAYVQNGAQATSVAAAERVKPKSGTQRWRVLRVVVDAGEEGVTDEEVQDRIGLPLNTVRPRRLELVEGGYVIDSGDTRPTAGGSQAIVWLATLDGITALEAS